VHDPIPTRPAGLTSASLLDLLAGYESHLTPLVNARIGVDQSDQVGRLHTDAPVCGTTADGARSTTAYPDRPDTYGAPAGTPCEPWCAPQAGEPEPSPLAVTIVGASASASALCGTICRACAANGPLPTLTGDAVRRRIIEHREHIAEAGR
jgi:hypothetical protein